MSTNTDMPLELYKANLKLALRTNKLLKETSQRWLDAFEHVVDESVSESQEQIDKLSMGDDWQSLASIPSETLVRVMQQGAGDAQAAAQAAITNQTKFIAGIQDAIRLWQHDTTQALGGTADFKSFNNVMGDFFKAFENASRQVQEKGHGK
jgi:hypothetical protein